MSEEEMGPLEVEVSLHDSTTINVRRRTTTDPVIFARKNTPDFDSVPEVLKKIEVDEDGSKASHDRRSSFIHTIVHQTDENGEQITVVRAAESSTSCYKPKPTIWQRLCCCFETPKKATHYRTITSASPTQLSVDELLPPQSLENRGKKTLVLDLDETLVHSCFRPMGHYDYIIPITLENTTHNIYVLKRPGVEVFLEEMSKLFEIVVYTASLGKYADPLLDEMDVSGKMISSRLFREHCVLFQGNYIKDLSLLGRDLANTLIIDNSIAAYSFQKENGVNCKSFIDDLNDKELYDLMIFLKSIVNVDDVRYHLQFWQAKRSDYRSKV